MMSNLRLYIILTIVTGSFNYFSFAQAQSGDWKSPHSLQELTAAPVALIPFPAEASWTGRQVTLNNGVSIRFEESDKDSVHVAIAALTRLLASKNVRIHTKAPVTIRFELNRKLRLKPEGYRLTANNSTIEMQARDAAGLYYGVQTLRQLLHIQGKVVAVPGCIISDWPAYSLRGFMHDNGRNFQSIASLKEQLEILSHYKFNTFHWHLTDNPAWRAESRVYPQLNDPKNRMAGRDPDSSYSFDDIRQLIAFAKERHIKIIPELDMPGHSAYFEPTFGFKMHTEKGMKVLEDLIDEFCREIPVEDCPVLHIGSDEVHIPNPEIFIKRMTEKVHANGRMAMVWNPGLKPATGTIQQVWYDNYTYKTAIDSTLPYVDAYSGYLNSNDALSLIQRYFFQQPCYQPAGTNLALGGILCCWPDTRVADKRNIFRHNPIWPGVVAYSEMIWCGRPGFNFITTQVMPSQESTPGKYFSEFEKRLSDHRDRFFKNLPFPYAQFARAKWQMFGPYKPGKEPSVEKISGKAFADSFRNVYGNVVQVNRWLLPGLQKDTSNMVTWFRTGIYSAKARKIQAWIGFETAARSNRQSAGIPQNGSWDANGGGFYINGQALPGPQWKNPGGHRYLKPTWSGPANEIPFTDEEFYWTRPPATISLKAGWNQVIVKLPRTYSAQNWMFAFVPVRNVSGRWVEDTSIMLKSE